MIKLNVAKYCEDCPYFTPISNNITYRTCLDTVVETVTEVCCENKEKCAKIFDYIRSMYNHVEVSLTDSDIEELEIRGKFICDAINKQAEVCIYHGEEIKVDD